MPTLPSDAHAHIEGALATAELAVGAIVQDPPATDPDGDGGYIYRGGKSASELIRAAALTALARIVDVISQQAWTTLERREAVERYQQQLVTRFDLHPISFMTDVRHESWWLTFQQQLVNAEPSALPSQQRRAFRSVGQQLDEWRKQVPMTIAELASAVDITVTSVERHLANVHVPRPEAVRKYELVFSAKLNRTCKLQLSAERPQTSGQKDTGSQNVGKTSAKRR